MIETRPQTSRKQYTYAQKITAVEAVQCGSTVIEVVGVMWISARTVFWWLLWFSTGGDASLIGKSKLGRPRKITEEMAQWLYHAVTMDNPKQYLSVFCFWNLRTIQCLGKQQYGVSVHTSTISRLLHSKELSPQRLIHKSYKQNKKNSTISRDGFRL